MVVIQTVYSGNSDREICSGFFSSRGTPLLCQSAGISASEAFFEIKLNCFLDTLLLKIFFFMIKINNFRGDLSDISAKTATLISACCIIDWKTYIRCFLLAIARYCKFAMHAIQHSYVQYGFGTL